MSERDDIDYELVIDDAGSVTLTCGGEVMWTSDADDEFPESFPDGCIDFDDTDQCAEVIEWLIGQGYLEEGDAVDIVEDDSAETGNFRALESEDDE